MSPNCITSICKPWTIWAPLLDYETRWVRDDMVAMVEINHNRRVVLEFYAAARKDMGSE